MTYRILTVLALFLAGLPGVARAQAPAPTIEYYHLDAVGSVRAVTNENGQLVRQHHYFPFGEEYLAQGGNDPRRFTGKERDAETGLDYVGARYYASRTGRFTTVDPLMDPKPSLVDPQRWNRYSYVSNRPLSRVDPDGRYEIDVHKHLTRVLAIAAGIDRAQAEAIAVANQGVDDSFRTGPFWLPDARRDYHFTTPERQSEMWDNFWGSGSTQALGAYLHGRQDAYSHAGLRPEPGHIHSHAPDQTFKAPDKADRMAADTFARLVQAAKRLTGSSNSPARWDQILPFVQRFNRAETLPEKEKILGQLVGFLGELRQ